MTTHLLIMYSLPFCSLRYPPSLLHETFFFEPLVESLLIFVSMLLPFFLLTYTL
ncbi:hypothetical protein JHK87_022385 [Glycine soja]|nr:hypothetical protein JHK87_022385 [Glycine soja]KAG5026571.1 hypothetical protein JHK86_022485 [Glycine max]